MTEQRLDSLFESARNVETQTTTGEVTRWLATAAATVTAIGLAAKLKLVLTKKMIFMMTGTLGVIGTTVVISSGMFNTNRPEENSLPVNTGASEPKTEQTIIEQKDPGVANLHETPVVSDNRPDVFTVNPDTLVFTPEPAQRVYTPVPPNAPGRRYYTEQAPAREDDTTRSPQAMRELAILPFKRLELSGMYDVIITQGSEYKLMVESADNGVTANNDGDLLTISNGYDDYSCGDKNKNKDKNKDKSDKPDAPDSPDAPDEGGNSGSKGGPTIHITVKELTELTINGIGNITATGLVQDQLTVFFIGVGDVDLGVSCRIFRIESSGVGTVRLSGKSQKATIDYSGVGDFEAYEFVVQELAMNGSGIGDVFLNAENSIMVNSSGVGDVRFKGKPATQELNFTGIGSVKPKLETGAGSNTRQSMEGTLQPGQPVKKNGNELKPDKLK